MVAAIAMSLMALTLTHSTARTDTAPRRKRAVAYFAELQSTFDGCLVAGVDFSTVLLNGDGSQKCFSFGVNNQYTFRFTMPICGNAPSSNCNAPAYSDASLVQYEDGFADISYHLGNYSGWEFATYQNAPAINASYTGGSDNGCPGRRSASVLLTCDPSLSTGNVFVFTEGPTCVYLIIMRTSDSGICNVLNSAAPTFMPSAAPYTSAPTLDCRREGVDVSGLAAPLGRQKCFSSLDKETHHIYSLHIPVCGAPPTYPCSPFPDGQVAQMGFQATVPSFNLGTYAETWFLASIDGAPALATLFLGGDVCMNIGARNSTLFIVCDRAMVFDSLVARESNCSYSFQLFTSDPQICDSLLPLASPEPSPEPTTTTSSPGSSGGGYLPSDNSCPCNRY